MGELAYGHAANDADDRRVLRQESGLSGDDTITSEVAQGTYSLGAAVSLAGLVLHLAVNFGLLGMSCAEIGCFKPGCTGLRPNRCLLPPSETYIIYWNSPWMYFRRIFMLVVAVVRAPLEVWLWCSAHRLLLNAGQGRCAEARHQFFIFGTTVQAILDVLSIWFWNAGALEQWHKILSGILIVVWVIMIGPVFLPALASIPGRPRYGAAILWCCVAVGFVLTIGLRVEFGNPSWWWFFWEWVDVSLQSVGVGIAGQFIPKSFRIRRKESSKGWWPWEAVDMARTGPRGDCME